MPDSPARPHRGHAVAVAARWTLLGVALLGAAMLAYALNRFRSFTDLRALGWYGAAAAIVAFGVAGSRLRASRRANLAVLCVTLAGLLFGAELVVGTARRGRVVRGQRALERLTGVPFDARSVPEVVDDLRAAGIAAVPSIVPKVMIQYTLPESDPRSRFRGAVFPLQGVSHRPTVDLCNESGRHPQFTSDRHGFKNPPDVWDRDTLLLVLIGDSFTHGYCVPPDSGFSSLLQRRWPATLNLGSPGSGPLSELATLMEFGLPLQPRLVLWVYYENDLPELVVERRHPLLLRYLDAGFTQQLPDRQAEVDSALQPWINELYSRGLASANAEERGLRQLVTLSALRTLVSGLLSPPPPAPDVREQLPLLRQVLEAARDRAHARDSRLVVVFLPRWERYFEPPAAADQGRPEVLAMVRDLGLPLIDLAPVFAADSNRARLFGRRQISTGHYSTAGYALVAGTIERALDSLRLLPAAAH